MRTSKESGSFSARIVSEQISSVADTHSEAGDLAPGEKSIVSAPAPHKRTKAGGKKSSLYSSDLLRYLSAFSPASCNTSLYSENLIRSSGDLLQQVSIDIRSKTMFKDLLSILREERSRVVFVAGQAGDGKTFLIMSVLAELFDMSPTRITKYIESRSENPNAPYFTLQLPKGEAELVLIRDLSEFNPSDADLLNILTQALKIMSGDSDKERIILVAANYGYMLEVIENYLTCLAERFGGRDRISGSNEKAAELLKRCNIDEAAYRSFSDVSSVIRDSLIEHALSLHDNALLSEHNTSIYDISDLYTAADFRRLMELVLNHHDWEHCTCECELGKAKLCPVLMNRNMLMQEKLLDRIESILLLISHTGEHINMRNIMLLLNTALFGYFDPDGRGQKYKDGRAFMSCASLKKDHDFQLMDSYTALPEELEQTLHSLPGETADDAVRALESKKHVKTTNIIENICTFMCNEKYLASRKTPDIFRQINMFKIGSSPTDEFDALIRRLLTDQSAPQSSDLPLSEEQVRLLRPLLDRLGIITDLLEINGTATDLRADRRKNLLESLQRKVSEELLRAVFFMLPQPDLLRRRAYMSMEEQPPKLNCHTLTSIRYGMEFLWLLNHDPDEDDDDEYASFMTTVQTPLLRGLKCALTMSMEQDDDDTGRLTQIHLPLYTSVTGKSVTLPDDESPGITLIPAGALKAKLKRIPYCIITDRDLSRKRRIAETPDLSDDDAHDIMSMQPLFVQFFRQPIRDSRNGPDVTYKMTLQTFNFLMSLGHGMLPQVFPHSFLAELEIFRKSVRIIS